MSLLNLNVNDAKDLVLLPDDEYEVRVISGEIKAVKKEGPNNGALYLNLRLEVPDHPEAEDIYHMLMLPQETGGDFRDASDREKQNNKRLLAFRELGASIGVDFSNCDVERDLPGCVGRATLSSKDDPQYGEKQTVKKFLPTR